MTIPILDHGYIDFVEAYGHGKASDSDMEAGIIEAARQSTQGSFRGWEQDEKLLNFLYANRHDSPFEFAGMVIEVQAPIFVFREWHRHRTQSYNEMSARYAPMPDQVYVPTVDRILLNQKDGNKQAGSIKGAPEVTTFDAVVFRELVKAGYDRSRADYVSALNNGVPKELARTLLPVGQYSRMRAVANLRNWLAFATLRSHPTAQYEIRQYSDALSNILREVFPRTMAAFDKGR